MPISIMLSPEVRRVARTYVFPSTPIRLPTAHMTTFKQYATATFKVLNAYAGWSNVNYVLNEVRDPIRTLKIAGPLGLGICAVMYILANIAYFACVILTFFS